MAIITDTTTDANGNIIINVSSSADDAITLATAGTYSDKNIIFNITPRVQSDWNQNDSDAADYVKNRPFYTGDPVETVLVEENTVPFEADENIYLAWFLSTFEATVGETYTVTWDGGAYECTCTANDNGAIFIGNTSIAGFGSDTGEPFVIVIANGPEITIATLDTSASHTFSISGIVAPIVKIPAKYIDKNSSGYIAIHRNDTMTEQEAENYISAILKGEVVFIIWGNLYINNISFSRGTDLTGTSYFDLNLTTQNHETYRIAKNSEGSFNLKDARLSSANFPGTRMMGDVFPDIHASESQIKISPGVIHTGAGSADALFSVGTNGTKSKDFNVLGNGEAVTPAIILYSSTADSTKKFRITVDDSGKPTFTNLLDSADSYTPTDLPTVTSSDSGKFLRVSSAGEWVAETADKAVQPDWNQNDSAAPDYVIAEAEATIAKSFSHGNLGRTIRFIAVSDSHNDANNMATANPNIAIGNKHCGQAIQYIADRIGLDFIAFLGDATWAGTSDLASVYSQSMLIRDIEQFNGFIADGYKGIPNIRIVGNHDQLYTTKDTSGRLWNSGAYNLFGRYCHGIKVIPAGYGYLDFDNTKVRVIYLNTSDIPSATTAGACLGMTQEQLNWLAETLLEVGDKADWKVLILSHAPLDLINKSDVLTAYADGTMYGSYDFANHNSAQLLANVHGHIHCYSYGYIGNKIRRFCIPNSNFQDNNHYKNNASYAQWADETTYPKTANSGKDTAFSLVTIDLDSGMCYVDNYGAGIDRVFSTGYKHSEVIVPTSISDISYSGDTAVGATIDKSKFTFTVTYSNGTTSAVTGATTVSPTTIYAVGNNDVDITYIEEGVTLTGTATIVGTEAPVVNLLNLNRTYVAGTTDESVTNHLDESKAYTNVGYSNLKFYDKACTHSDVSENSITVKESGLGGICITYPVHLPDLATQDYVLSFNYSGPGKQRIYYKLSTDAGAISALHNVINDTAGASGTQSVTISAGGQAYTWLIIMFSSNTGNMKSYTNVKLEKVPDPVAPVVDNLIDTLGVQANTRISSSGLAKVDSRSTGYYMINFIPVSVGDIIRLKGFIIPTSTDDTMIAVYSAADESTKVFANNWSTANAGATGVNFRYDGDLVTITAISTLPGGYLRFDAKPTTTIDDCIVTRNQEIS